MNKRFQSFFICFCLIVTTSFLFEVFEKTFLAYFFGLASVVGYVFLTLNFLILIYHGMLVIVKNIKFQPPEPKLYYKMRTSRSINFFDYIYAVTKVALISFFEDLYRGLVTGVISFFALVYINYLIGSSVVCLNVYNASGACFQSFNDYVFIPAVTSIGLFMYTVVLRSSPVKSSVSVKDN